MGETLKEKTSKGLFWGTVNNGLQQVLNLVFGIFLARLLDANDYGMVGMITIFSLIASALQESGFISALVNKEKVSHSDYNAVFWFNILVGIGLYVILFFCAPLIADFYGKPELIPLSRYTFLTFVISSFGIVPRAILFRELKTKETAITYVIALAASGTIGIILAYNGMSYWGIVTQSIIYCILITIICWYYSKWRPNFHINLEPLREMVGFSSKMLITSIFSHLNGNLFSIMFGKFYTQADVGNYTQSNKWNTMGHSFITGTIQGVAQPVLTKVRDDVDRQRHVFRKMLRFTAFISFPLMFGLSLIAHELIVITITEKWLAAVIFLQILCIDGAFIPIVKLYSNLIISQGKSNIFMWNTMAVCLAQLIVMVFLKSYGVDYLVKVFVTIDILWLLIWHYFVWREIKLSLIDALKDITPFFLLAALTMIATYFITLSITNIYLLFFSKIIIAAIIYIGALWLLDAKIMKESIQFFMKKKL